MGRSARIRSLAAAAACGLGVLLAAAAPALASPAAYTTGPGDTYWLIAQRLHLSVSALEAANPTHPWWNLYPGLRLNIPGGGPAANPPAASAGPVNGISAADLALIAQMAVAEEGNRSYLDQLGVAAVIVNRLRNGGFGATVRAVLFAPYQFTPVLNGYFYQVAPTATSLRAARAAAAGQDPTGGALYFYDPGQGVTSSWIYSRQVTTIIDGTVYAR